MTTTNPTDDTASAADDTFVAQLFDWINGAGIALLVDVASRCGLLETMTAGPGTSTALAERAGLSERHVRELLDGLTAARVVEFDPAQRTFTLPPSRAACLTGTGPTNFAPTTGFVSLLGRFSDRVIHTLHHGGGIPYPAYRPEFTTLMDRGMRRLYDALLVDGYIPAVSGLHDRLERGARVGDLGCGTGHVANLLARAYPASTFIGFDIADDALAAAHSEASDWGLTNVHFERLDVRDLPTEPRFDVLLAFDAIHDQAQPAAVLRRSREALAPDGLFVMVDVHLSSRVDDNIDVPLAPWFYTCSLFHCMQVSLAEHGAGLGTCWGWQTASRMLAEAGYDDIELIATPAGDPVNAIFVAHPPAALGRLDDVRDRSDW